MTGIIFFLLKLILIVLTIFFLIIVLVLFVPIKYRICGSYLGKIPEGEFSLSWLFGFLRVVFTYDKEKRPVGEVRLLGIKVYEFFRD